MTAEVYTVFAELWAERRLDTQRVFLYKESPITKLTTAYKAACRSDEDRGKQVGTNAPAV